MFLFRWGMALESQKKEGDYDMMPRQGRAGSGKQRMLTPGEGV